MRPLSASEAIGPALERTKDLLFRPFRWRTFFKIAAVAFFAEMGGFNSSNFSNGGGGNAHSLPPAFLAFLIAFAVIIGLISLTIGLILLYIGSRLQLVLVELVATRQTLVSPMWRRVGPLTWRWIGFKVLFFLAILAVAMPFVVPLILFFVHHHGGNPFSGLHITEILLYIAAALVALLVIGVIYTLVHDLAMPAISLEGVPLRESLRRLRALVDAEPGQVALYVFLRFLLGLVFGIIAEMAVVIVLLVSLILPAIVGVILWAALHNTGTGGTVVLIGLGIVALILFLCWAAFVGINLVGSVLIFNQSYALYFLGGRYPLLGDLLDRSTPPPPPPYFIPPPGTPVAPV